MNYYSVEIRVIKKSEEFISFFNPAHSADEVRKDWNEFLCYFNQGVSDKDRIDYQKGNRLMIAAWKVQKGTIHTIAACEALEKEERKRYGFG